MLYFEALKHFLPFRVFEGTITFYRVFPEEKTEKKIKLPVKRLLTALLN